MKLTRNAGFTLVELMVVVVIVAVIAAIAYPGYSKYMLQTRRSDAQIILTQAAAAQEKFYSDCGHYAQILSGTNTTRACATSATLDNGRLSLNNNVATTIFSPNQHYVLSIVAPTASTGACPVNLCFTLQATPATAAQGGSGLQIGNGKMRINSTGAKSWDKANSNNPNDSTHGSYASKWTDK